MNTLVCLTAALLCLGLAQAAVVIRTGSCPVVHGQPTLDTERYLGTWYEYQRFPAVFEFALDCTSAQYDLIEDGKISVLNNGTLRVTIFGQTYVIRRSSARGVATVPDPSKPAELSVSFGGYSATSDKANYFIQETDYDNYSVVFSCFQLPGFNIQFAWILTRQRGIAPSNLQDLENNLRAAGVNTNPFFVVDQQGCEASH
ncbi:apolipoprotein d [Plakobranchus ocellatus]|uniref:Apolipoprotein D n=1 Tax=Plakobranchus ocellatus TaxID=259542 RepID=A0AAV4B1K6_9GAST|nr:apolipoprotein d [Plakobranchus ocellatus]